MTSRAELFERLSAESIDLYRRFRAAWRVARQTGDCSLLLRVHAELHIWLSPSSLVALGAWAWTKYEREEIDVMTVRLREIHARLAAHPGLRALEGRPGGRPQKPGIPPRYRGAPLRRRDAAAETAGDEGLERAWTDVRDAISAMPGWTAEPASYHREHGRWHVAAVALPSRGRHARRRAIEAVGSTEVDALRALAEHLRAYSNSPLASSDTIRETTPGRRRG